MAKQQQCKTCGSVWHTAFKCPENPNAIMKARETKRRMQEKSQLKATQSRSKAVKVKKVKTTKPKTKTRSQLVKQLDTIYSQYVRLDKSDNQGYATCVTCNDRLHWTKLQNGHFISRSKYPTRWHDDNCFPQCMRCNVFLRGNYIEYTVFMIDTYGRDYIDELKRLSVSGEKIPTPDLKQLIEHYSKEVKQLKSDKMQK